MSTVIWNEGTLYADTQGSIGRVVGRLGVVGPKEINRTMKIFKIKGKIYGVTGTINGWLDFKSRMVKRICWGVDAFDEVLIIEWNGKKLISWKLLQVKILGVHFSTFKKRKLKYHWAVMGSGDDFAIEALKAGLTPSEAIQYAADRDPFTNDEVVTLGL